MHNKKRKKNIEQKWRRCETPIWCSNHLPSSWTTKFRMNVSMWKELYL